MDEREKYGLMTCPTCQTENPPGAKFCNQCGTALAARCPNCGHENPPGAKFCNECGAKLTEDGRRISNPPISNLHSLISPNFASKLQRARETGAMVGERRIVTMLFCDVKGSTAAAGQLDPEDWAQIMNGVFEYMIRPVYKYEGTVARLMGDAILAFFGAPVAHEDDPQRAILAGIEIVEGFQAYREQIERDWRLEINVRVGINTGLVMVGAVGSDLQMEYTALGDAINLAARMEQTATPGTVQVAEDTYKLAAPAFEWEDLGNVEVKGKDEPVRTYRPIRLKAAPGRLRGIEGLDAPMVGREAELGKLQSAVQRLGQGVGSIIFITGEAGLGKSRLIKEMKAENRESKIDHPRNPSSNLDSRFLWHETASFSYETTQPYALFQRLLRRVCGVEEGDSPAEMWEKFMPILSLIPADVPDQGGVFEALFAFHSHSASPMPEGEAFKRQLFDLMERIWRHWAGEAPRIFIFDDLHWTDPASIELLTHLFRLTDSCPLVILCATRLDRDTPGWRAKETALREYPHRYLEINLRPLTAQNTNELVDKLLTISDLPARLRQRILEKTDGNPFFIEEVVRTLIDSGLVVRVSNENGGDGQSYWRVVRNVEDIEIPGNLQSLLIARIDRLEEDARRTLQLASVIGRSFYFRVLEAINQAIAVVKSELDRQLLMLQRAELIHEAARFPELEYVFRHSLTQEAAYSTILLRQRREFHRRVGEAIEKLFPDRVDELAAVLAHHFEEAGDPRAGQYHARAGEAAFRLYAIPEAISHYTRALEGMTRDRTNDEVTHLFRRLGRCYELQSQHRQAVEVYDEMLEKARALGDRHMELAGLIAQGTLFAIPTPVQDAKQAEEICRAALALARTLDDRRAEARIEWIFLLLNMYSGFMDLGIPYGERAAELARALGMDDLLAHALQDLSLAYMAVGDLEKGRQALEEVRSVWEMLGNQPMLAENLANSAFERLMRGKFDEALAFSDQSFAISERIRNDWGKVNCRAFVSQLFMARGEVDRAAECQRINIPLARQVGHPGLTLLLVQQAWMYSHLGDFARAKQTAQEAVRSSEGFGPFHAYALPVMAGYFLREGDLPAAEALLKKSQAMYGQYGQGKTILEIDIIVTKIQVEWTHAKGEAEQALRQLDDLIALMTRAGAHYFVPEIFLLKGEILQSQGRLEEANESLTQALQVARGIGCRVYGWRILAVLARLAEARGEAGAAVQFRAEAAEIVHFIAAHTGDPELRASFTSLAAQEGIEIGY